MDFALDETQQSVADLARTVLRSDADHGRSVQALSSAAGYDEALWKSMAQSGLLSLCVPTAQGGDGLGAVEAAVVLAEVGRQTIPVPALATLALGVLPLAALGGHPVLADVADGAVLTAALHPMSMLDGALTGRVRGVLYADQAVLILVPTPDGIALISPTASGVTLVRTPTSTGAPEYTLSCDRRHPGRPAGR